MESTLFVPVNLSFSENLRCLKMPLLVGAISQKRWPSETCFVFAGQNVNSGKFKHLKYSENVKFSGTNNIDSILGSPPNFEYLTRYISYFQQNFGKHKYFSRAWTRETCCIFWLIILAFAVRFTAFRNAQKGT